MDLLTAAIGLAIGSLLSFFACFALLRRGPSAAGSSTPARLRARSVEDESTAGRLDELERRMKTLQLEWSDSYEKLLRMARRFSRVQEPTPIETSAPETSGLIPSDGQPINRQTLLARAKRAGIPLRAGEVAAYNAAFHKQTPSR